MQEEMKRIPPVLIRDPETDEVLYTLDFSRKTVAEAENRGFKIAEIQDFPWTGCATLFFWAMRMHHKGITRDKAEEIFLSVGGIEAEGLIKRLAELYNQAISTTNTDDGKKQKLILEL